jgi:hypothetical protein
VVKENEKTYYKIKREEGGGGLHEGKLLSLMTEQVFAGMWPLISTR